MWETCFVSLPQGRWETCSFFLPEGRWETCFVFLLEGGAHDWPISSSVLIVMCSVSCVGGFGKLTGLLNHLSVP